MRKLFTLSLTFIILAACAANNDKNDLKSSQSEAIPQMVEAADTAYFAGGCFWCVEASFDQIEGVIEAISGYSGGAEKNPTYKDVSYGKTGHAEAVMVIYKPEVISYDVLLDIFFTAHNPTELNRQGPDVGKQYRSSIFYTSEKEKSAAQNKMNMIKNDFDEPIVTELKAFTRFWPAEEYHQDFERKNPNQAYVVNVSKPKIDKVAEKFKDRLKSTK